MQGKIPPSAEVIYEMLSEKYGWTPSQIREQKAEDIMAYIKIIGIKNYIERNNQKKYGRR